MLDFPGSLCNAQMLEFAGIFSRAILRCFIFSGVFCKFNPTIFCCLGLFGKDDLAERPMNKIRTFQSSSAFLASLGGFPPQPIECYCNIQTARVFQTGGFAGLDSSVLIYPCLSFVGLS